MVILATYHLSNFLHIVQGGSVVIAHNKHRLVYYFSAFEQAIFLCYQADAEMLSLFCPILPPSVTHGQGCCGVLAVAYAAGYIGIVSKGWLWWGRGWRRGGVGQHCPCPGCLLPLALLQPPPALQSPGLR